MRVPTREALRTAARRSAAPMWQLLQATAAATAAWALANWLGEHEDPFFAPIAAVVALSSPLGERGSSALRLLAGVFVGIMAGELTVGLFGGGYGRLALATFVAMAIARSISAQRLVVVQAGGSAILTVAVADGQVGTDRLLDAAIGAGIALLFSQVLFSPEPVRLMRRAEQAVLERMSAAVESAATALRTDDDELAERATGTLRALRDDLSELARTRKVSKRVVRHSAMWRTRNAPAVDERENAGHLDLLGGSLTMLVRSAIAAPSEDHTKLAGWLSQLASTLGDLAADPGSREVRQAAVERALDIARGVAAASAGQGLGASLLSLQIVTTDLLVFSGVDAEEAKSAVEEGTGQFRAIAPPSTPRLPFTGYRKRPPR